MNSALAVMDASVTDDLQASALLRAAIHLLVNPFKDELKIIHCEDVPSFMVRDLIFWVQGIVPEKLSSSVGGLMTYSSPNRHVELFPKTKLVFLADVIGVKDLLYKEHPHPDLVYLFVDIEHLVPVVMKCRLTLKPSVGVNSTVLSSLGRSGWRSFFEEYPQLGSKLPKTFRSYMIALHAFVSSRDVLLSTCWDDFRTHCLQEIGVTIPA